MIKVNGLKNCDTCKKALKWLEAEGLPHSFRDVRGDAVSEAEVAAWGQAVGWKALVNKSSTTWRGFSDAQKAQAEDGERALPLLVENPTLIKRPVFEAGDQVIVGFRDPQKQALKDL